MGVIQEIDFVLREDLRLGRIPERYIGYIRGFVETLATIRSSRNQPLEEIREVLLQYRRLIINQVTHPVAFSAFHRAVRSPEDLTTFGKRFFASVVQKSDMGAFGLEHAAQIVDRLRARENVILLANHQTEADPQAISLILEDTPYSQFADDLIWVAGERVLTDPMSVPFSLGRNLLCIYSKKHMEGSVLKAAEKKTHNVRAMRIVLQMLREGGLAILVAPSGGRDRPSSDGTIDVAPFDAGSVEMFRLLGAKSSRPCHFYPLALATHSILPPPKSVGGELGEARYSTGGKVMLSFGAPIDIKEYPGHNLHDKAQRRERLAEHAWQLVRDLYHALPLPKTIN